MTKRFGDLFREERKRSGNSMGDIARHLSVSVTYLSDVERCTRPPLTSERIRVAAVRMGTAPNVLQELLRTAQAEQGEILLPLPSSEMGRETGAALQRQWAMLDDDAFARIMEAIEKKGNEK